jgi:sensor histidine kinase YesM
VNFSVFSFNQYAHVQLQTIKLERTQLNLQFEALKSQLSPHFLFNGLNTISSLIYKDIRLTERFIRQLAGTYRYILRTGELKLVAVEQETIMAENYFFMQKTRFGDSISLEINLDDKLKTSLIPPLTLQMLIENALKHNQIREENNLKLTIKNIDHKFIIVENNILPKPELLKIGNNLVDRPKQIKSHKIGLANIRSRYAYFTNRPVDIVINQKFTVKLPVIQNHPNEKTIL